MAQIISAQDYNVSLVNRLLHLLQVATIFQHDGIVPVDRRKANITPVFKKGQKYQRSNYRPISLTCIVSKLIEHVVCSSIMDHANMHNIFYPLQHGFCARRSCETQLIDW